MLLGGLVTGPRIDVDCNVLYVDTIQSSSIHGAYDLREAVTNYGPPADMVSKEDRLLWDRKLQVCMIS